MLCSLHVFMELPSLVPDHIGTKACPGRRSGIDGSCHQIHYYRVGGNPRKAWVAELRESITDLRTRQSRESKVLPPLPRWQRIEVRVNRYRHARGTRHSYENSFPPPISSFRRKPESRRGGERQDRHRIGKNLTTHRFHPLAWPSRGHIHSGESRNPGKACVGESRHTNKNPANVVTPSASPFSSPSSGLRKAMVVPQSRLPNSPG